MDRREEIISSEVGNDPYLYRPYVKKVMDTYMKETVLEAFEYVVKNTTGHSIDVDGSVHFKVKDQWLSTEELFQNFL